MGLYHAWLSWLGRFTRMVATWVFAPPRHERTQKQRHAPPHVRRGLRGWLLVCLCALAGCAELPSLADRAESRALGEAESLSTALGQGLLPVLREHPDASGIHPLTQSREAFAARAFLAQSAQRTLDVQYYIWRADLSGFLLLDALHSAAERGVRVRLLLDDHGTSGLDAELAALNSHANIEVRLFNPFVVRWPKWIGYLTDFSRANRRMHNKSFTADNQVSVVGGRNVGDEYFGATDGILFADLDVLSVGPVVRDVSADFDRYWSSGSAYPVERLLPPPSMEEVTAMKVRARDIKQSPQAHAYVEALKRLPFNGHLLDATLPLEWAATRMVSDDPAKGLGNAENEDLLMHQLAAMLGAPEREVDLVSPYFVPTAAGVEAFAELVRRGVRVRILTNSFEATDVALVHAGHAKRRKAVLASGVTLYELKRQGDALRPDGGSGRLGSSGSSLHAKTFAVDEARVFVGSFNFDPRSANLNTELGFVIDSPALARGISAAFDTGVPAAGYEVRLDDAGSLYWIERRIAGDNGEPRRYTTEPGTSFWQRLFVGLLSALPIEWML